MEFFLWLCRSLHVFAVVVWLGGLLFQTAVAIPITHQEDSKVKASMRKISRRFIGFIWISVWTILITGVLMIFLHPEFQWFSYEKTSSILLGIKKVIFLLMVLYTVGYARMLETLDKPTSNGGFDEIAQLYLQRVHQFRKISIILGILALLISTAMYTWEK